MSNLRNPFHTLYATEGINELDFPAIFSPTLIPLVLPLFQPGNVMLSGTQGTGKSMLLALLDTDIRLAFWKHEKHSFSVRIDVAVGLRRRCGRRESHFQHAGNA